MLDGEAGFCHRFVDDADGVGALGGGVDAFLGDEGGDFFAEGGEVVFALFLADLEFSLLEYLGFTIRSVRIQNARVRWCDIPP